MRRSSCARSLLDRFDIDNEVIFMIFILSKLRKSRKTISVMESCTGGEICSEITNVNGASDVFKCGVVAYSNEYKIKFGVKPEAIDRFGVYSFETVFQMGKCISEFTNSDYGLSVSGKLNFKDSENPEGEDNLVHIGFFDSKNNKFFYKKVRVYYGTKRQNKETIKREIIRFLKKIL